MNYSGLEKVHLLGLSYNSGSENTHEVIEVHTA